MSESERDLRTLARGNYWLTEVVEYIDCVRLQGAESEEALGWRDGCLTSLQLELADEILFPAVEAAAR